MQYYGVSISLSCCCMFFLMSSCVCYVPTSGVQSNRQGFACVNDFTDLQCPPDHKIAVRHVVYASRPRTCDPRMYGKELCRPRPCDPRVYGKETCCTPKSEDCYTYHDDAILSMNTYCSGHRDCTASTKVTSGITNNCEYRPTMGIILYDCVEEEAITSFCSQSSSTGETVYLASPNYPDRMLGRNNTCQCYIQSNKPTNITVQSIDLLFTGSGFSPRVCEQTLEIRPYDTKRLKVRWSCTDENVYGFQDLYKDDGQEWLLSLSSLYSGDVGGRVWISAKASTDDTTLSVACSNGLYTKPPTTLPPPPSETSAQEETIDLAVIIGCAVAAILIIIIIAIVIAWRCQRRQPDAKPVTIVMKEAENDAYLDSCSSPPRPIKPFPDVCNVHDYSSILYSTDHMDIENESTKFLKDEAPPKPKRPKIAAKPMGLKGLKKRVSFKEILSTNPNPDAASTGTASRPNSYISGNGGLFSTFGKQDDEDDLMNCPPPDWLDDPSQPYSYAAAYEEISPTTPPPLPPPPSRKPPGLLPNGGHQPYDNPYEDDKFANFYANMMSGEMFDKLPKFDIYDEPNDSEGSPPHDGVIVIENEIYQPGSC